MERGKLYERKDDNSPGKVLVVHMNDLGDLALSIVDYKARCQTLTVEFMYGVYGGGCSLKVREALQLLADAIEEDNRKHPMPANQYYDPAWHSNSKSP